MKHTRRNLCLIALLLILMSIGVTQAQDAAESDLTGALALLNSVQSLMIVVIVVIALLVMAGGFFAYMQIRRLQTVMREQRSKLAEVQALYRELQGARKRTENALANISGQSAELSHTRGQIDASMRDAVARMTQAVALLPVGEKQYQAQDYVGALSTFLRAVELDDDNPLTHYRAGYTSIQLNQLDRAMQHLNRALDIDPEFAPAQAALGYLYRRLAESQDLDERQRDGLYTEAERYLTDALKASRRLMDEDGEAWMGSLAGVYRRRRQYEQAIRYYMEAAEITPFASYPYASIALVSADKSDYTQMYKNFERVEWRARNETSSRPTNPWGHANLLLARLALGRDDKLIEEEFTLTFLSLPKESAFIVPTLTNSLRRLEWALASSNQPSRAEKVARLMQRIERLGAGTDRITTTSTQIMRAPVDNIRSTSQVASARNGGAQPKRETGTQAQQPPQPFSAPTRQLGESAAYDPNNLD
jgi:tetratricopeptide (TPR) repeat protein